jgi:phosphate transport system substrate-binding protein
MKQVIKYLSVFSVAFLMVFGCQKKTSAGAKETILKGRAVIWTDETLTPIIEDQIAVFESQYDADMKLVSKSEAEVLNALLHDSAKIAILSRQLTPQETKAFQSRKIFPKTTKFATDGIAFIRNRNSNDTLIALNDVLDFIRGKAVPGITGLAFDNPNSSTVRHLTEMADVTTPSAKGFFSFHTNEEAIKYVAENDGMIGVIGLNWLAQPSSQMQQYIGRVSVLSVKGASQGYYAPTQNNIAEGKYPLARDLFVVNCQGFSGLGMGFASFIAGERGQRIILKSGLLPAKIPGRRIVIRNKINKEN